MSNIIIKISNFVHYFYREGGCLNLKPIFTIIFFTFRVGRGVSDEKVPISFFPLFFFLKASLIYLLLNPFVTTSSFVSSIRFTFNFGSTFMLSTTKKKINNFNKHSPLRHPTNNLLLLQN